MVKCFLVKILEHDFGICNGSYKKRKKIQKMKAQIRREREEEVDPPKIEKKIKGHVRREKEYGSSHALEPLFTSLFTFMVGEQPIRRAE